MLKSNFQRYENQKQRKGTIVEVWDDNFKEEIEKLSYRLDKFKYIAMVFDL
jgi:hypothetical protein